MRAWLAVLCGAALGAALAAAVRWICALLLKRRGFAAEMKQTHAIILLACLVVTGGVIGWRAGFTLRGLYLLLLMATAACAFYIDAKHRVIPNELILAVVTLAAVFGLSGGIPFRIWSSLLGLVVCFAIFMLPSLLGKSVGLGDVKLAGAMGFALGLSGGLYAIACMGALVLAYVLIDYRVPLPQRIKTMIPMGPFLSLSFVFMSLAL